MFHLRYDQLVLASMASVIGLTLVFACGVERGKQLVRSERVLLARQHPTLPQSPTTSSAFESPTATPSVPATTETERPKREHIPAPAITPKVKRPGKPASGKSRYAVQVVTYSRPQLAKQELDRLQARGERAFLVMRDGRTILYVGPFPSKVNASEKVAMLKARYQDCFVRTL
jgi:cell division septation protein DedD